jgi:hypothetical protein
VSKRCINSRILLKEFKRNSVLLKVIVIWLDIIANIYGNLGMYKAKNSVINLATNIFVSPFLPYGIAPR